MFGRTHIYKPMPGRKVALSRIKTVAHSSHRDVMVDIVLSAMAISIICDIMSTLWKKQGEEHKQLEVVEPIVLNEGSYDESSRIVIDIMDDVPLNITLNEGDVVEVNKNLP